MITSIGILLLIIGLFVFIIHVVAENESIGMDMCMRIADKTKIPSYVLIFGGLLLFFAGILNDVIINF